ncbi:hypothetical protein T484DRAFT_1926206 [Baffinella frigidus]|nr:hypothetical protein T484DRAFT_1926206 [Cryptophyta sp. CCMP2293]
MYNPSRNQPPHDASHPEPSQRTSLQASLHTSTPHPLYPPPFPSICNEAPPGAKCSKASAAITRGGAAWPVRRRKP